MGSHEAPHITFSLFLTGLTFGVIHVLSGPDHLSALALLSVGNTWKAISLGLRWGLGHSTGLIVVAAIFISLKGEIDLEKSGRYFDAIVGAALILLGSYGILHAFRMYKEMIAEPQNNAEHDLGGIQMGSAGHEYEYQSCNSKDDTLESATDINFKACNQTCEIAGASLEEHFTAKPRECKCCPMLDLQDPTTQRIVSFLIGILHGVAGPGGILGVLPAVEMTHWQSSIVYLASFVVSSTLCMGIFAAFYGEVTYRLGNSQKYVDVGLRVFSASLSLIFGTIWLVLSLMGKLDEYFD